MPRLPSIRRPAAQVAAALLLLAGPAIRTTAQAPARRLEVETIMQDPAGWIGEAPSGPVWSDDSRWLYFRWNPRHEEVAGVWRLSLQGGEPEEVPYEELSRLPGSVSVGRRGLGLSLGGEWDAAHRRRLFVRDGDLWLFELRSGTQTRLTFTAPSESSPTWSRDGARIFFTSAGDHYALHLGSGELRQYVRFTEVQRGARPDARTELQKWLAGQEAELLAFIRKQQEERERFEAYRARFPSPERPLEIPVPAGQQAAGSLLTPDGRFVVFRLRLPAQGGKRTVVPDYVREDAFTQDIPGRTKVGEPLDRWRLGIADTQRDSVYYVDFALLDDLVADPLGPAGADGAWKKDRGAVIPIQPGLPIFAPDGRRALLEVNSLDNKNRFLLGLELETGALHLADHQHDEAWIGGPIYGLGWLPDGERFWYLSEKSGYAHLYTRRWDGSGERALTSGSFEVYGVELDAAGKRWFFQANDVHPGVRHFYSMPLEGGAWTRYTAGEGSHDASVSPDGRWLADLWSRADHPPELYLKRLRADETARRITESTTEDWRSYGWTVPPVVTFPARDGASVYARLYRPADWRPGGPAVVFVHGAGYLQNAHTWWSSYFREYMFHHLLMQRGFLVLDMDYRGSAGYGRDWRTGIYRHMGGPDLTDEVDGVRWLVAEQGVDPARVGLYGGSYGGFITLMAMFTQPEVFAAGAALRPVTDWAHYNHGYTAEILNVPQADSLAYVRSSPIYHAAGLKGALLICHGLVDTNVHAQDSIRLAQRLIELRKGGWELALYPVESHGFTEPTSWMDEYKRILRLFEMNLKRPGG
jgi:dipeptidyl aminopeptidase/acylaminoacyl peptidase